MKITAIYDNGGKTLDRYTIVTDQPIWPNDGNNTPQLYDALATDASGTGFSQWCSVAPGDHLGKRVHFEDLSAELQAHIARVVFEG